MKMSSARRGFWIAAVVLGAVGACNGRTQTHGGSETNWLAMCVRDADCAGWNCVCGLCTEPCSDDAACTGEGSTCASTHMQAVRTACAGERAMPTGVCLKGCSSGTACAKGFTCESDVCVPSETGPDGGAGAGGGNGAGGATSNTGGSAGNGMLRPTSTTATEFVESIEYVLADDFPLNGKCLPRSLPVDDKGQIACSVVAIPTDGTACQCDAPGRRALTDAEFAAAKQRLKEEMSCDADGKPACDSLCGCAVRQETGTDLQKCQNSMDSQGIAPGFCYVDPAAGAGDPAIVARCPATERQVLRLIGSVSYTRFLVECTLTSANAAEAFASTPGAIGDPCITGDEYSKDFSGFAVTEVNVETGSPACSSGVCLVANFQGRASCPFGQRASMESDPMTGIVPVDPTIPADQRCYVPGAPHVPANLIDVPVDPQLVARSPEKSVYCSCRCDGPAGTGPFCACPDGFECKKLIEGYGSSSSSSVEGSYCVKPDTYVNDPTKFVNAVTCHRGPPLLLPGTCGTPDIATPDGG